MTRPLRIAALCLTAAASASGCGSSSGADTPATTSAAQAPDGTITVNLTEYKITAAPDTAAAGPVTFDVANAGAIPHEFVVVRTGKPAAKLLKGSRADETGNVGELSEKVLTVGAKRDLTLNLKEGHYALICNLPGHYQGGMHTDFTVK